MTFNRIERVKKTGIYFMLETTEFFSLHFIAHSRPPPSWTGCSQSVWPLVVFLTVAHVFVRSSSGGALCLQICVLVPSFDGFLSRRPLLVDQLIVRGNCPPKPCLFRRTVGSHPEQLAARVSTRWRCMSYFQWKNFLLRICNSTPLSG